MRTPAYGIQPQAWADGLIPEEIYDKLIEHPEWTPPPPQPLPGTEDAESSEMNGNDVLPVPEQETAAEKKQWAEDLRRDISKSVLVNKMAGHDKLISEAMQSRLDKIVRGTVPWSRLFRGDLQQTLGWDIATFSRPNRKLYPRVTIPSFRAIKERVLLILIDVSGSVGQDRLNQFRGNVGNAAMCATRTVIVCFDDRVRERIETTDPKKVLKDLKLLSGSHSYTDVRECFDIAAEIKASAVAGLTDGYIEVPETPYPNTLWCIPPVPEGRHLPWGRHYIMDELF
jgi:predicted metal-dependent peptidase